MVLEEIIISVFSWGSPVGIGIFLIGLGYLFKSIVSSASAVNKGKRKNES